MSLADWPRVETLFHRLAPLEPAARESLLLEISSEDPALGRELVSLLAAHDGPGVLDRLTKKLAPMPHGAAAPGDELVGTSVAHFEIEALIGRGGMGDVYKARDSRLGRDVALKFLPPWLGRDPAARDRFLVEARIVSSIDHPNVCTLLEMGETDDGRLFLILPYYEGETLKGRLGREALEPAEAVDVALQVARGLSAAHERGVVHRDIKPANLLLTANGRVKILDFGVAKLADVSLTRTGETPGTAVYMSPEQAAGRAVDERTDLWSLGIVLHEMLTGTRPDPNAFSAGGLRDRAGRLLPPALVAVLEGLLAKTPAERYPDAHSVAGDLEVLAADPSSAARPAFSFQRFLAELKRRHVFKVAAVYGIAGFGVMQAAEVMFPRIPLPEWTVALVVWLVLLGFPIALVLAWAFEATPHGVRRTHRVRPAILDAIVAQPARRRWPVGMAALLGGVLLVGSGVWWVARDRAGGAMPSSATQAGIGVVVMPFAVVGETDHLQIWSEGPVHLLGELIDGLEGLRSIDVMTAWNQRFGEGVTPPASEEQLALARELGGSLVVRGRAVGTRDSVVLTAEVSDLRNGESGSVRVRGAAEDLSLGERLTMEMLREGLLPTDAAAEGTLAGATTRSWEAFASFLEGEQAYRRGRYEDASASFVRAVELDSTFARAMYRAAQSFMWRGNFDFETEYRDRAERFAAASTRRDSLLYTAYPQDQSPQAIERLERFVRLYPDDFDGWIHLGEAYYHLGGRALQGPDHYRNAWNKAIELGGVYGYAESYHHLLEGAFARRDSARARELLSGYAALDHDASACPGTQLVYATEWGDEAERARALDEIRSVDTEALGCAWVSIAASSAATEEMERRDRARLSSLDEGTAGITLFRMLQARVMRGELRAAAAVLELAAESGFPAWAAAYDVHLHLTIPAWKLRAASIPLLESMEPWAMPKGFGIDNASPFWLAVGAVEEGRWNDVEEVIHGLEVAADTLTIRETEDRGPEWPANRDPAAEALELAEALAAYAALKRESSAKNLARFEEALGRMTWIGSAYLRYAVGLQLAERGDHREAVRYFSSFYAYQWVQYVPAQYHLARAYERLGQLDQAREHYRIFIGWWATADSELGPWVEEARAALARLS